MKFIVFEYTDAKGKRTIRTVVPIVEPTDKMMALDISELEEEVLNQFAKEYNKVMDAHQQALVSLYDKYDLNNRIRQFKPSAMVGAKISAL